METTMRELKLAICSGARADAPAGQRDGEISIFTLDDDLKTIRLRARTQAAPSPSFLGWAEKTSTLYVASEIGVGDGRLTALDLSGPDPVERNHLSTGGNAAVHLCQDRTGKYIFVANYHGGPHAGPASVAVFSLKPDGAIDRLTATAVHQGHGPDRKRQKEPHCHSVMISPDNRLLVAADLGTDSLCLYRFDAARGAITLASELKLPPGTGPRHSVFHPSRPLLYVTGELSSTLLTVAVDSVAASGDLIGSMAATRQHAASRNYPSGIAVSPDGHFVLAANRGADRITVYWIDPESGTPTIRDETACGGLFPRAIRFDPSSRLLAVANQNSDDVCIFGWDFAKGALSAAPLAKIAIPRPLDMVFFD